MKNLIFALIGLLIGIGATFYYVDQSKDKAFGLVPATEEQKKFRQIAIDSLKKAPDVSRGLGNRITKVDAERHINDFKGIQGNLKSCLDAVDLVISTSYSFGIDEVRALLDDIEMLNSTFTGTYSGDNELTGIRIHLGKNFIEVEDEDGNTQTVFYVDAFITPVNKKGKHIFTDGAISYRNIPKNADEIVILEDSNSGSLNNSNPCPDVCP